MPFIDRCHGCPYPDTSRAVGTWGDPASRVLLVGEAPGAREIVEGRPFIGGAGDLLQGVLAEIGCSEDDVFITNSVACKPDPLKPTVGAISACHERLLHDLTSATPVVIVTLGATAYRAVTGRRGFRITDVRGQRDEAPWGTLVPTLHPARVLRVRSERPHFVADLGLAFGIANAGGQR